MARLSWSVLLFLALLSLLSATTKAKKKATEWDNVDWDKLEEEWEEGDEEVELENEKEAIKRSIQGKLEKDAKKYEDLAMQAQAKLMAKRGESEDGVPDPNSLTMEELQALSKRSKLAAMRNGEKLGGSGFTGKDGLGQEMMFVHLKELPNGKKYAKREIDSILQQWKDLLQTGGITAQVYNIESETTLVTVPGYKAHQAKNFLLSRPEVVKVRFDNSDYYEPSDDDEL